MSTAGVTLELTKAQEGKFRRLGHKFSHKRFLERATPMLVRCIKRQRRKVNLGSAKLYIRLVTRDWQSIPSWTVHLLLRLQGAPKILCSLTLEWPSHSECPKVILQVNSYYGPTERCWSRQRKHLPLSKSA